VDHPDEGDRDHGRGDGAGRDRCDVGEPGDAADPGDPAHRAGHRHADGDANTDSDSDSDRDSNSDPNFDPDRRAHCTAGSGRHSRARRPASATAATAAAGGGQRSLPRGDGGGRQRCVR
jgi:hypothetical protein